MTQLKAIVRIRLKPTITDVNGAALLAALKATGFADIADVRSGKVIDIEFEGDTATAHQTVTEMCNQLLAQRVTETYEFDLFTQAMRDGKPSWFPVAAGEPVEVEDPIPPHYQIDLSDENIVFGRCRLVRATWANPDSFCVLFAYTIEGNNQEEPLGLRMDMDKKAFLDDLPDPEATTALHENRERLWDLILPGYVAVRRKYGELARVEAAEADQDAAILAKMGLTG